MEGRSKKKDCFYERIPYSDGTEFCVEFKCLLCYHGKWKETVEGPYLQG